MKQLQNGIYTFNTGERNWGEEVNQNFEALDNLISGVAGNNDKIELLSEKIQTNTGNFEQTKDDLIDNINNTKNGLQDQIDILNNNILTLKYKIDNMDISVDSVKYAEEADVAKKLKKSLTIGNMSFNGEADAVVTIDGTPIQNSSNLINSNAVYDALELKQDKATTLNGYGITDAYTKTQIDDSLELKQDKATTLSGYGITDAYTKTQVDDSLELKQDKATTLNGYGITDAYTKSEIDDSLELKQDKATTLSGYGITDAYTKTQVDKKVSDLVNSAPETLDTLNELANALGNDPNFATTVATQIGTKANDNDVVHKSGNETISGVKNFNNVVLGERDGIIRIGNNGEGAHFCTLKYDGAIHNTARQFVPLTNNEYNLGTSTNKWANVYATTFHGDVDFPITEAQVNEILGIA